MINTEKWKHTLTITESSCQRSQKSDLGLWSPAFLARRTGFVEDNFSIHWGRGDGFRMIQVHHIQEHLLLCGPVPNRPGPVLARGLEVRDPGLKR